MCAERRGEVAARGETEDAYARRVNAPFRRARTHGAQCTRRVLEHGRVLVARPQTVLEHEGRDAQRVEPLGDGPPLIIGEVLVAAAGADDDGRARGLLLRRQVRRERRDVFRLVPDRARRAAGPQDEGRVRVRLSRARKRCR